MCIHHSTAGNTTKLRILKTTSQTKCYWPNFLSPSFRLWLTHKLSVAFIWYLVPYSLPSPPWGCEIFAFHLHIPASALILVTCNCCWSSVSTAMPFFSSRTLDSKQRTSSVLAVFSFFSTCISNFIWLQSLDNFLLDACNSFILASCRQKHQTLQSEVYINTLRTGDADLRF